MSFRGVANIDPNQHKGLILSNSITNLPLVATGLSLTNAQPLHVAIVDGTGAQVTSFGGQGGTSSTFGSAFPSSGTAVGAIDASGNMAGFNLDGSGNLKVSGSLSVGGTTDNSAFVAGTTAGTPAMGFYHSTIDTVTDGRSATIGMTSKRAMLVNLQTAAGVELTNTGSALDINIKSGSIANTSFTVTQATGTNLHTVVDSGHIIIDSGSTTAVTGTVTISGAVTEATLDAALIAQEATTSGLKGLTAFGAVTTAPPTYVTAKSDALSLTTGGALRGDITTIAGTAPTTPGFIDIKGADGNVFVRQATGSNLHMVVDSGTVTAVTAITNALPAGSNVIGHVITDTGSTTAVTGTVTISGAVTEATLDAALISQEAATTTIKGLTAFGAVTTNAPTYVTTKSDALSLTTAGGLRIDLKDTASNSNNLNVNLAASAATVTVSGTVTTTPPSNASTNLSQINAHTVLETVHGTNTAGNGGLSVGLMGEFDDAAPTSITENQFGNIRMSANRNVYSTLRDAAGNERGVNVNSSNQLSVSVDNSPVLGAGSAVIGHVITDATSVTAATLSAETTKVIGVTRTADGSGNLLTTNSSTYTAKFALDSNILGTLGTAFSTAGKVDVKAADGDVFVRQGTGTNLHTVVDSGTVTTVSNLSQIAATTPTFGDVNNSATETGSLNVAPIARYNATQPTITDTRYNQLQISVRGELLVSPGVSNFAVQATLAAETTKVIGVVRTADGSGNLYTTNSTTYTAKFAQDTNILGTLGTAFSTAGKVDVKAADGDVFVRQTTGSNLHTALDSGTLTSITNTVVTDDLAGAPTGAAVPANAMYGGGIAKTALSAAATDGNLTGEMVDKFGRQVILNNSIRDLMGTQTTTISASVSETTIITAVAATFLDLMSIFISNTSATAARVDIRDTTAGSVIFQLYIPAGDMRGLSLTTAWPQTTVNTNWTAQSSASVTDLRVSALFIKNK